MSWNPPLVPDHELVSRKIPPRSADWVAIQQFALTFDGYAYLGQGVTDYWGWEQERRDATLGDLRTRLFLAQRRHRWTESIPDPRDLEELRDLLDEIRRRVQAGEAAPSSAGASLRALRGDITRFNVDAIVNAANEELERGGGVCGAIFAAAGPELAKACRAIGHCPTGAAVITPGFKLTARHIIHAVGPVWRGGSHGEPELLASAYGSSLRVAAEHHLASIVFPAISTGIYGYPLDEATAIAVRTVRDHLQVPSSVKEGLFSCFDDRTLDAYRRAGVAG